LVIVVLSFIGEVLGLFVLIMFAWAQQDVGFGGTIGLMTANMIFIVLSIVLIILIFIQVSRDKLRPQPQSYVVPMVQMQV
jgi:uncharacterized membrane protein